jgi:YfiH family protein
LKDADLKGAKTLGRQDATAGALREVSAGDPVVPRVELAEWRERYGVVAGMTTRPGSLGLWSDESVGQVMGRWRAFLAAFAPRFPGVVSANQIHGTHVRWHAGPLDGWLITDGADGHATAQRGVLLCITVADCVPVYLAAPDKGTVALLHAGWRGTVGGVLARGLDVLQERAGVRAAEVIMHCGIGICGTCYEVGSEVVEALRGTLTGPAPELRVPDPSTPARVDLRQILARQARELGVPQVTVSSACSAHDRGQFFSHRASGGRDGRMVAYVGVPADTA